MPTYEYECNKCHKVFEKFQKMTDRPLRVCPDCRGRVKRLFGTGAGIIFKGSGFYSTDYRSDNYKASVKKEGESKSEKNSSASPDKKTSK